MYLGIWWKTIKKLLAEKKLKKKTTCKMEIKMPLIRYDWFD